MTTEQPQHKFEDDDGIMECVNCGRHPSEGKEPCSIPDVKTRAVITERGRREDLRPCPFCGKEAERHIERSDEVFCGVCIDTDATVFESVWNEAFVWKKIDCLESICRELAWALEDSTGILWAADRANREQALEQAKYNQETLAKYRAEMGETI